jgi:hypothetical protein
MRKRANRKAKRGRGKIGEGGETMEDVGGKVANERK